MELSRELTQMDADQLRNLTSTLLAELAERDVQISKQHAELSAQTAVIASRDQVIANRDQELKHKQLKIDQLTHEMAVLKRWQFGKRSEKLNPAQRSLLEETIDADLEAIERELEALQTVRPAQPKAIPRRTALPAHLPRREVPHEPDSTVCSCGCQLERVGEEISERLDYPWPSLTLSSSTMRVADGLGGGVCISMYRLGSFSGKIKVSPNPTRFAQQIPSQAPKDSESALRMTQLILQSQEPSLCPCQCQASCTLPWAIGIYLRCFRSSEQNPFSPWLREGFRSPSHRHPCNSILTVKFGIVVPLLGSFTEVIPHTATHHRAPQKIGYQE